MNNDELQDFFENGNLKDFNFIKLTFRGGHTFWNGKDFNDTVPTMIPRDKTIAHYKEAAYHFKNGLIDAVNGQLLIEPAVR